MENSSSNSRPDLTPISLPPSNRAEKVLPPIFSVDPSDLEDTDLEIGLSPVPSQEEVSIRLRGGVDRLSTTFIRTLYSWTKYAVEKGLVQPCKYEQYLNSQCFANGNVYSTMAKAMELGNSSKVSTVTDFWQMATPAISCWIENKRTPLLGKMKHALAKGPEIATEVFEALDVGYVCGSASTAFQNKLLGDKMIDDLKVVVGQLLTEKAQHEKQTLAFVKQVNSAANSINESMKASEDLRLKMVQAEVIAPPPLPSVLTQAASFACRSDGPIAKATDQSSASTSHSGSPEGTILPVKHIAEDGTYAGNNIVLTVVKGRIGAVDSQSPGFIPLQNLIGRDLKMAQAFLSRDLRHLHSYGVSHPMWLDFLKGSVTPEQKSAALEILKTMPSTDYQWARVITSPSSD